jgi:hypothetical protein
MTPRYWLSRVTIALEVLVGVVLVGWLESASITAQAIERTGWAGWLLLLVLGAACVICIVDVIVNDLMPARFTLHMVKHWRHVGLLAIAMLLAMLGVLVSFTFGYTTLLLFYWLNAALAASTAFFDAFARMRRP